MSEDLERKLDALRDILTPSRLGTMPAREVMLLAGRFERMEPAFRQRFGSAMKPLAVTVLASLSSQHLCSVLKLFLYAEGFAPHLRASEFDGLAGEGMDPNAGIWAQASDAIVVLPALSDIKDWPRLFASEDQIADWIEQRAQRYEAVWRIASRGGRQRLYHALHAQPTERPLGNLEHLHPFSRTRCVRRLNERLAATRPGNVTLVDFDYLSGLVGRQNWVDEAGYFLSKQPMSLRELPIAAAYLARLIAAGEGRVHKCLVVDLDNTLWGGTAGDDGPLGIRVSPSDPVGEAYLAFQHYLLALKERGVLLAVCSKNEERHARAPFESNPDMVLKASDFAAFIANWDDKVTNLQRIARDLNIGLDSLVFFDDNPAEREIVKTYAPDVFVVNVPSDPAQFVRAIDASFAFEWPQLTAEDLGRAASYETARQRTELAAQFADYDAYLRSLEMKAEIGPATADGLVRLAQLFGKTNQFNLRTVRYSEVELRELLGRDDSRIIEVRFSDKFSNYGVMAGAVLQLRGQDAFIENWVMSCRVFKRTLEQATLNALVASARLSGAERLVGEYLPTPKNDYVANLFATLGFRKLAAEPQWRPAGGSGNLYLLDLVGFRPVPHFVDVGTAPQRNGAANVAFSTRSG